MPDRRAIGGAKRSQMNHHSVLAVTLAALLLPQGVAAQDRDSIPGVTLGLVYETTYTPALGIRPFTGSLGAESAARAGRGAHRARPALLRPLPDDGLDPGGARWRGRRLQPLGPTWRRLVAHRPTRSTGRPLRARPRGPRRGVRAHAGPREVRAAQSARGRLSDGGAPGLGQGRGVGVRRARAWRRVGSPSR